MEMSLLEYFEHSDVVLNEDGFGGFYVLLPNDAGRIAIQPTVTLTPDDRVIRDWLVIDYSPIETFGRVVFRHGTGESVAEVLLMLVSHYLFHERQS